MSPFSEIVVLGKASEKTQGGGQGFTDPSTQPRTGHLTFV